MRIPKQLTGEAAQFWKRNAPALEADGRLTDATVEGFVMLCEMYGEFRQGQADKIDANKIVALSKQVQNMMAAYGMTPASRKKLKLEKPEEIGDVLEKVMGFAPQKGN